MGFAGTAAAGEAPCPPARFFGEYTRVGDSPSQQIAIYELSTGGDLGFGGPGPDRVELQFFGEGYNTTGTLSLTAGGNANFATCTVCVLVVQDEDAGAGVEKLLFQFAGSAHIAASTPTGPSPTLDVTFSALQVQEVTINPSTFVSTPVVDGACYRASDLLFEDGFEI